MMADSAGVSTPVSKTGMSKDKRQDSVDKFQNEKKYHIRVKPDAVTEYVVAKLLRPVHTVVYSKGRPCSVTENLMRLFRKHPAVTCRN